MTERRSEAGGEGGRESSEQQCPHGVQRNEPCDACSKMADELLANPPAGIAIMSVDQYLGRSSEKVQQSGTPRVDEFVRKLVKKMDDGYDDEWYDWAGFARQLERELEETYQAHVHAMNRQYEEILELRGKFEAAQSAIWPSFEDGLEEAARLVEVEYAPDKKQHERLKQIASHIRGLRRPDNPASDKGQG